MSEARKARLGALQIGSAPDGTAATLERVRSHAPAIRAAALDLLVLPEALLGGYPKGADFGARIGYRVQAGREQYRDYFAQAVTTDGPEIAELRELASHAGTALVLGVVERDGTTLYCTALLITADGTLAGRHRKLVPTGTERLVWAQGTAPAVTTVQTAAGRVGAAICWENYMPLFRAAVYDQGIDVWCAPTVDERDIWQSTMRHIAYEARCFVISACQVQPPASEALGQPITLRDRDPAAPLIRGGSCIISPLGELLAGPVYDDETLLAAEVDLDDIVRARFDLDVTGHSARPDLFALRVSASDDASADNHSAAPPPCTPSATEAASDPRSREALSSRLVEGMRDVAGDPAGPRRVVGAG